MVAKSEQVSDALNTLAEAVRGSTSHSNKMSDVLGWNAPPLDKFNLSDVATNLATSIRPLPDSAYADDYDPILDIEKIEHLRSSVVPQLWNGNGIEAVRTYLSTLSWLESDFAPLMKVKLDWDTVDDSTQMPRDLAKRLRALNAQMNTVSGATDNLAQQVSEINRAHDAALSLPTDLESLSEARLLVQKTTASVESLHKQVESAAETANGVLSQIQEKSSEADKLVENTSDAYRAATTKGLSEAFQTRADRTAKSMWTFVVGLIASLGIGAWLGSHRISMIQALIEKNAPSSLVFVNLVLAVLSIAAPVWFAWIATKQIGHRFRLSEDYAFKASVARAYEGYRREAAKLDEDFAKRLFASALDRLEEPPLRFVEQETHGSPWHELLKRRSTPKPAAPNTHLLPTVPASVPKPGNDQSSEQETA
ncbi:MULTISPECIES: hypothetical protein [Sphingobium]|jgi:hypothetical protein|uniref:hypothetical protein n=1 Tax=Sphingobium TaxID=165695 RepID=UPI0011AE3335|nr:MULTISPECIES: hypothetical protein [Sphingobium]KAA9016066.1 hypothetical protein F4U94_10410 [Sphingobium limneticum]